MDYVAPATLAEAFAALDHPEARPLAGGQSLVAMMNLGLVTPARLVSLRRIAELRGLREGADGGLRIGAMTTHAELAAIEDGSAALRLLSQAARVVAYPAVRAWGTLGGSVAHADPAADYPVALAAAGAVVEVASAAGSRRLPAADFFRGLFETALTPGEIVSAIHLPGEPRGGGAAYRKLSLVAGDFAIVSVAALAGSTVAIAVGGCAATPLVQTGLRHDEALEAGAALAARCDPPSDHRASGAYRRKVLPELVRRTVRAALEDTKR